MCLGEAGRVVELLDERRALVRFGGREAGRTATALLDVVVAEGGAVEPGDVVIVSMGLVLTVADESQLLDAGVRADREEASP